MSSLFSPLPGGLSHTRCKALRPFIAVQVESATTATPDRIQLLRSRPSIRITSCTPRRARVSRSSYETNLPPDGHRAMTAYRMLGRETSMPKIARPVTMSGLSPLLSVYPASDYSRQASAGPFFRQGDTRSRKRQTAKVARRPVLGCDTTLAHATHSVAGTCQPFAAAHSNNSRPTAPAWRSGFQLTRTLSLPPTSCSP